MPVGRLSKSIHSPRVWAPPPVQTPKQAAGIRTGGGAHTRGEWIDLESLPTGMKIAGSLVLSYFHN